MIANWWRAHALEVVIWSVVIGFLAIVWLVTSFNTAWRERQQKKRDGLL